MGVTVLVNPRSLRSLIVIICIRASRTTRLCFNVMHSSDAISHSVVCSGGCDISIMHFFVVKLKFKVILCEKMHMISIFVRYGFRWYYDKPY